MDTGFSESDMSRLTTMLTRVGAPFTRWTAAGGSRAVEIGGVEFWFEPDGTLNGVVMKQPKAESP